MSDLAVTLTVEQLEALIRKVAREERPAVASAFDVLTREQVAKLIQVHPNVVSRYVRTLGLPARKIGGEWRFIADEVRQWVASRERVSTKGAA